MFSAPHVERLREMVSRATQGLQRESGSPAEQCYGRESYVEGLCGEGERSRRDDVRRYVLSEPRML